MKAGIICVGLVALLIVSGAIYYFYNVNNSNIPPEIQGNPPLEQLEDTMVIENSQAISSNLAIGSDKKVAKQASFAIFTNGTFRVFTNSMYHNLSDDVFIQSINPSIIQIKKEGITWDDFFKTLPFKLDPDCLTTGTGQTFCTGQAGKLKFYLNGLEDKDALDKIINQGDKLLVSFGKKEAEITDQLEKIPNP